MRISELIQQTPPEVLCLSGEETVGEAIGKMAESGTTAVLVVDAERPVGIFTRGDLVRCWQKNPGFDPRRSLLKRVMTPRLITAGPGEELVSALALMRRTGIEHLPILEGKTPVALLTLSSAMAVQMNLLENEARQLSDYLADLHDAGQD